METDITDRPHEPAPTIVAQAEYTLDPEDYVEGYLFAWVQSLRKKIHIGAIALVVCASVFALFLALFLWLVLYEPGYALLWVLTAIFLTLSYAALLSQIYMVAIPYRKHVRHKHFCRVVEAQYRAGVIRRGRTDSLSLTSAGFTEITNAREADADVEVTEHKEFRVRWSAVQAIDVTDHLAVFLIGGKGFLFLPKHGFKTEEAFLGFVRTAEELRRGFEAEAKGPFGHSSPTNPSQGMQVP